MCKKEEMQHFYPKLRSTKVIKTSYHRELFRAFRSASHTLMFSPSLFVSNAAAAIAVSMEGGIPIKAIKNGIADFNGVGRRYEKHKINIKSSSKILIDDYGHHPIEVLSTIQAYKEEFPNRKTLMIFQPHRFSRTAQLFDDFVKVLKKVDTLFLLDIYAASEKPIKGIDSRTIVETLKQQGHKDVTYLKNHNDINALIKQRRDDFDILITQGAGSVSIVCNSIIGKWKV